MHSPEAAMSSHLKEWGAPYKEIESRTVEPCFRNKQVLSADQLHFCNLNLKEYF